MDFKVAGTSEFVTAIQLDTKLDGIPASAPASALTQAREARLSILLPTSAIDAPDEMSEFAPRVISAKRPRLQDRRGHRPQGQDDQPDPGGHRTDISIQDDGTVYIGATDGPSAEAALGDQRDRRNPESPRWASATWHRGQDHHVRCVAS
ncbi:hypothetical protein QJS66_06630 [Kocuria rhizophila]|nr:hypothetical protein QJS66_06630 [Kocuria rhizophila]